MRFASAAHAVGSSVSSTRSQPILLSRPEMILARRPSLPLAAFLWVLLLLLLSTSARGLEDNEIPQDSGEGSSQAELFRRERNNDTVLETYQKAVEAYLSEDWDACIQGFRNLIYKYKEYKSTVIRCRRKCRIQSKDFTPMFPDNVEDMNFYEKKIKETLCLLECNHEYRQVAGKNALKRMPLKEEKKILSAEHYGYLHGCYYQKKYYQEAANAVFTYLIYHPDHKGSISSLTHYMSLPNVDNNLIRNLEAESFVEHYTRGIKAYEEELYDVAVSSLETSLRLFLDAEEQCRIYCEGPINQDWHPEFTTAVSNHYVYNLRCKQGCAHVLSTLNGEYRKDFFVNHYNYLQFAYYKLGDLKSACQAVESYLLFFPVDEAMTTNKDFYLSLPDVEKDFFKPREESEAYLKRREYELRLLLFINNEFTALEDKIIASEGTETESEEKIDESQYGVLFKPRNKATNKLQQSNDRKIFVIADERFLGGKSRFLIEGLLNQTECDSIMHLAEITAWEGDGYEDNKSPHSEFERFEGVTIGRLAVLAYLGLLDLKLLDLLLNVTDTVKEETEKIFHVNRRLYITYTHLVCRTTIPGSPANRSDYSHTIHADNCLAEEDGSCYAGFPAYYWRDYSTILYLNDDFQGGNFIFVRDKRASVVESTVRPKCGRMLSFPSGAEHLHGVTAITRGRRCALAVWFTRQQKHEDPDVELARVVLKKAQEGLGEQLQGSIFSPENYEKYKRMLLQKYLKT